MGIFNWRRRRKRELGLVMDEREVLRVFNRVGCMSCTHWKADHVKAAVGAFLLAAWDHKDGQPAPKPPTPQTLSRLCCKYTMGEGDPDFMGAFVKTDW